MDALRLQFAKGWKASAGSYDCCDANRDAKEALQATWFIEVCSANSALATAPILYMPRIALPDKHFIGSFISQFPASGTRRSLGLPLKQRIVFLGQSF
jgi:hypothetical protein